MMSALDAEHIDRCSTYQSTTTGNRSEPSVRRLKLWMGSAVHEEPGKMLTFLMSTSVNSATMLVMCLVYVTGAIMTATDTCVHRMPS